MSVVRFGSYYRTECDYCDAELPAEATYPDAVAAMYRERWATQLCFKTNERRVICRRCLEDEKYNTVREERDKCEK